jgi:hypothetical protein
MTELTGIIGLAIAKTAELLQASTAFQQWVGVENSTDAGKYIAKILSQPLSGKFVLVTFQSGQWNAKRESGGGGTSAFKHSNEITLIFSDEYSPNDEEGNISSDAADEFINGVDAVIKDMETLSNTGSYIYISGISMSRPPSLGIDERRIYCEFSVNIGI